MSDPNPSSPSETYPQAAVVALRTWAESVAAEDAAEAALLRTERSPHPAGRVATLQQAQRVSACRAQHALAVARRIEAEVTLLTAAGGLS